MRQDWGLSIKNRYFAHPSLVSGCFLQCSPKTILHPVKQMKNMHQITNFPSHTLTPPEAPLTSPPQLPIFCPGPLHSAGLAGSLSHPSVHRFWPQRTLLGHSSQMCSHLSPSLHLTVICRSHQEPGNRGWGAWAITCWLWDWFSVPPCPYHAGDGTIPSGDPEDHVNSWEGHLGSLPARLPGSCCGHWDSPTPREVRCPPGRVQIRCLPSRPHINFWVPKTRGTSALGFLPLNADPASGTNRQGYPQQLPL